MTSEQKKQLTKAIKDGINIIFFQRKSKAKLIRKKRGERVEGTKKGINKIKKLQQYGGDVTPPPPHPLISCLPYPNLFLIFPLIASLFFKPHSPRNDFVREAAKKIVMAVPLRGGRGSKAPAIKKK